MTTDPVPGGYLDRQHVQRARQANNRCRQIVGQMMRGNLNQAQVLNLLLELTFELGEQNNALHEMLHIRARQASAGGQPPEPVGDSGATR